MKKVVIYSAIAICVFGVGVCALVSLVFFLTGGAVESANQFLAAIQRGDTQAAYEQTSAAFQNAQDEGQFEQVVRGLGLTDFQSASWNSRAIENNLATLHGAVLFRSGGSTKLTIQLIRDKNTWKVLSLEGPVAGAHVESPTSRYDLPPSQTQVVNLVGRANQESDKKVSEWQDIADSVVEQLLKLEEALKLNDFTKFHQSVSKTWMGQTTAPALLSIFKPLQQKQADWSEMKASQLVLDEPLAMDRNGLLMVKGHVPLDQYRLVFDLKFINEGSVWKLFGINVREVVQPPPIPPDDELIRLVHTTLSQFQIGVTEKNFDRLFTDASSHFKSRYTASALENNFRSFLDTGVNLSGIENQTPSFSASPTIDRFGLLALQGKINIESGSVGFELSYAFEQDQWKLMGIKVTVE